MKLINLNGGSVRFSRPANGYINLTSKQLTSDQEQLLNMELNCHILSRPRKFQKHTECEILLDDVNCLACRGEVTVEPTFKQAIIAEASKTKGSYNSIVIEKRHIEAAKLLLYRVRKGLIESCLHISIYLVCL
ncbi:hypothetical protein E2C01_101479 [Portunus trituberculatus]|uniref:Uncharacterized protein n=1 Tax=Portunus trituberculatus TaxID=210409 RepID=A0A5B7KKI8_PORTR|nr:hypothetical protein [Portunus trituberculatus]